MSGAAGCSCTRPHSGSPWLRPFTFHSLLDHQGLIGRSSGYIEGLSDEFKKTIEDLKIVDAEYLAIVKKFKKESLGPEANVCKLLFS